MTYCVCVCMQQFKTLLQVPHFGPTFHSLTVLTDVDGQAVATKAQQVINLRLDSSDWHSYLDCCLTSQLLLLLLLPLQKYGARLETQHHSFVELRP